MDEPRKASHWNLELKKMFHVTNPIPLVFIDPMVEECGKENNEDIIFKNETSKLWNFLSANNPFLCDEETCKDMDFTKGIPSLLTDGPISSRVGSKIAIQWLVWFGDCSKQIGIISYEIRFKGNHDGKTTVVFHNI